MSIYRPGARLEPHMTHSLRQLHASFVEVGVDLRLCQLGWFGIRMGLRGILLQVGNLSLHRAEVGAVVVMLRRWLAVACQHPGCRQQHSRKEAAEAPLHRSAASAEGAVTVSTRGLSSVPEIT